METVLITGGTGMIGTVISGLLVRNGYNVIILTRNKSRIPYQKSNITYANWDIEKHEVDSDAIAKADHIIHLAGAGVADKRWTKKRKLEILNSRVRSGNLLVSATQSYPNKIRTFVSAAATGWYGPDPVIPNPDPFTERAPAFNDFLGQTCRLWEESLEPVKQKGIRLVKFRAGVVLSREGGALKRFLLPLKFRTATVLGSGEQMISWIHVDDLARIYLKAIRDTNMNGVYNAVSPEPVSNRQLMKTLAKTKLGRNFITFRVPAFILKAVYGELSIEVLKSTTVSSARLKETGYNFLYPDIQSALKSFFLLR
jgi:uncharacterized protein